MNGLLVLAGIASLPTVVRALRSRSSASASKGSSTGGASGSGINLTDINLKSTSMLSPTIGEQVDRWAGVPTQTIPDEIRALRVSLPSLDAILDFMTDVLMCFQGADRDGKTFTFGPLLTAPSGSTWFFTGPMVNAKYVDAHLTDRVSAREAAKSNNLLNAFLRAVQGSCGKQEYHAGLSKMLSSFGGKDWLKQLSGSIMMPTVLMDQPGEGDKPGAGDCPCSKADTACSCGAHQVRMSL